MESLAVSSGVGVIGVRRAELKGKVGEREWKEKRLLW